MIYREEQPKKPEVLGPHSVGLAFLTHILFVLAFVLFAVFNFKKPEVVIPIDLTVVVNQNLDGEENEPPPLNELEQPPKPEPPP
jgi:hypothetical protein